MKIRKQTSANFKFPIWSFANCFILDVTVAVIIGKSKMLHNNALLHFVTTAMKIIYMEHAKTVMVFVHSVHVTDKLYIWVQEMHPYKSCL